MGEGGGRGRSGGRFGKEGRVSSSCNAIDPVAVHHVDTILVRSFQIAGVVGVGFCAITSVAGPTHACTHATHARVHAHTHVRRECVSTYMQVARERERLRSEGRGSKGTCIMYPGSALLRECDADCAK